MGLFDVSGEERLGRLIDVDTRQLVSLVKDAKAGTSSVDIPGERMVR